MAIRLIRKIRGQKKAYVINVTVDFFLSNHLCIKTNAMEYLGYFASIIMAILVIPFGQYKGIISFEGDFVFFAYILGTGKFFSIISAFILCLQFGPFFPVVCRFTI